MPRLYLSRLTPKSLIQPGRAPIRLLAFSTSHSPLTENLSRLDQFITSHLKKHFDHSSLPNLKPTCSFLQYRQERNIVLDEVLPAESSPSPTRRADIDRQNDQSHIDDGLVLVVHAVGIESGIKYTTCSGFIVETQGNEQKKFVVTCAHTLAEIEYRYPSIPKRSFILFPSSVIYRSSTELDTTPTLLPIPSIPTSLPRADILICSLPPDIPSNIRSLPISPYPIYQDQEVLVHCFGSPDPPIPRLSKTTRYPTASSDIAQPEPIDWLSGMGWRRWVKGRMMGYRGALWEEVEPGTADHLPWILTSPLPSPGSSGGPILDAQSGAVVGVISGTRMDNRIEGERGWGASAENIFELFSLPGFTPASKKLKSP